MLIGADGSLIDVELSAGHVLKFGIRRERPPFVFPPDFLTLLGGKESPEFEMLVQLCQIGFSVLRKHHRLIYSLLKMVKQLCSYTKMVSFK